MSFVPSDKCGSMIFAARADDFLGVECLRIRCVGGSPADTGPARRNSSPERSASVLMGLSAVAAFSRAGWMPFPLLWWRGWWK